MGVTIPTFPGTVNHVRCMDHTVSLTAKSVLSPFNFSDSGDHHDNPSNDVLAKAEAALSSLAEGLDMEEAVSRIIGSDENAGDDDDNTDGWVDERTELTDVEREELRESALPVRTVLVKVRFYFVCMLL